MNQWHVSDKLNHLDMLITNVKDTMCFENFPFKINPFDQEKVNTHSRCLKITEKVSFNIASEASYVYILSGQKFIKKAKNGQFWRGFENLKLAVKHSYQTCQFQ